MPSFSSLTSLLPQLEGMNDPSPLLLPSYLSQFDQFQTDHTSGCFHPHGLEVILNSEVWDLRTLKLLR